MIYAGRVNEYKTEDEYSSWFTVEYRGATSKQTAVAGHRQWGSSAHCVISASNFLVTFFFLFVNLLYDISSWLLSTMLLGVCC